MSAPRQSWAFLVDSVEFTAAVIAGETSLGGSESACLGLASALQARGHDVHIFTTKLAAGAAGADGAGVFWHPMDDFTPMNAFIEWDVVCALRNYSFFGIQSVQARLRLLWSQDLLVPGQMQAGVMSCAWAYDRIAYVSTYHQQQWEALQPELAGIGWASRNGIDLGQVPAATDVVKDPSRIIHISRPERGLGPLLRLWPMLKQVVPSATLQICRYSSMYDDSGWGEVCRSYDRAVEAMNAQVGGITYLGELTKSQLYRAISEAAVMWYPGVPSFAETNCIAATEANACGTPFVGSLKGALPETARPSYDAGLLIPGDAERDEAYAIAAVDVVAGLLKGCRDKSFAYRALQKQQRAHAARYGYDTLAAEWEAQVETWFRERYEGNRLGVLKQLLHEDDHVAARQLADQVLASATASETKAGLRATALDAQRFCDFVIAGKDHTAENYAEAALKDVQAEAEYSTRFAAVRPNFEHCRHVLDVACGNGSFAISLAAAYPEIRVTGLDYAQGNIDIATAAAAAAGVADRVTFQRATVYDFDAQQLHDEWQAFAAEADRFEARFDGLFVGEFIEHTANHRAVIDGLEAVLSDGAVVVYTCPHGACAEMVPRSMPLHRGHVHRFHWDDIRHVWGAKKDCRSSYLPAGWTARGNPLGNWMIRYEVAKGSPAGDRDLATRITRTRPMPGLTVGLIAKDSAFDIGRCLASVWNIADEIVVGDTGSSDDTVALAEGFKARVLRLDPIEQQPEGFAGARNAVLAAATGDWFLWIDTDEQLVEVHGLRKYLHGAVFNGYVIHQNHLQLDAPQHYDIPVRLFRRRDDIRFYGCVHEQPQMGDCNGDITPTLDAIDVQIVHTGYLTERVRQDKMEARNRPLIVRDQQVFPERLLGKVILLRETVLRSEQLCREAGGLTLEAQSGFVFAISLHRTFFADPGHKLHKLARPWYESALRALGQGWEVELALAGKQGGLQQAHAKPERLWVADGQELERLIGHRTKQTVDKMAPPTFHTEPFALPVAQEAQPA